MSRHNQPYRAQQSKAAPYAGNCIICAISNYEPRRPDNCVSIRLVEQAMHVDIMAAGRRALGSDTFRPLKMSYATTFGAANAK